MWPDQLQPLASYHGHRRPCLYREHILTFPGLDDGVTLFFSKKHTKIAPIWFITLVAQYLIITFMSITNHVLLNFFKGY